MIILDTNVVSELMRSRPDPHVVEWVDAHPPLDVFITAVTARELLHGVARLDRGRRRNRLAHAVDGLLTDDFHDRVLPFDLPAAVHFADVAARRERAGRPISVSDGEIAAIARSHDASVATRNGKDFELTGVAILDLWPNPTE
jgi:predicted nucleic acid-binding protein